MGTENVIDNGKETLEEEKGFLKEEIEERKELIEDLFEKTEAYIKTNIELAKAKAAGKLGDIAGSIVTQLAVALFGYLFLLMLSVGAAIWIGDLLNGIYLGFMIMAGFYALLTLLVIVFKKSLIKNPIGNAILTQFMK